MLQRCYQMTIRWLSDDYQMGRHFEECLGYLCVAMVMGIREAFTEIRQSALLQKVACYDWQIMRTYIYIYIICICIYVYIYMYIYVYVYMYMFIYVYVYIYVIIDYSWHWTAFQIFWNPASYSASTWNALELGRYFWLVTSPTACACCSIILLCRWTISCKVHLGVAPFTVDPLDKSSALIDLIAQLCLT